VPVIGGVTLLFPVMVVHGRILLLQYGYRRWRGPEHTLWEYERNQTSLDGEVSDAAQRVVDTCRVPAL
jgi:hypothetical protein